MINAGIFYKHFNNPIEQLFNGLGGRRQHIELRQRQKRTLWCGGRKEKTRLHPRHEELHLPGQCRLYHSRVKDEQLDVNRSLQGQSPYILNLGILYDLEKYGLNVTLLFNQIGQRIYLVGDIVWRSRYMKRPARFSTCNWRKSAEEKGEFRLNISDIINQNNTSIRTRTIN